MNYKEFMKAVDEILSNMTEVEKTEWIHNVARTTKEHKRFTFLNSLKEEPVYMPLIAKNEVEEWCRKIENQEIYFEASSYEIYGASYWDTDYAYEYADSFEIGKELSRAFQIAEDLLFQKEYQQASVLYEWLCSLSFPTLDSDIEEWDELDLESLVEERLVSLNLKQIALNLMYAKYQVAADEERVAALYRYLSWNMCKNIKVEEMFTVGPEELKGIGTFMEEWISFLKNTAGDRAGGLLSEACIYQGDINCLSKTAREVWRKHPALYKDACEYLLNKKSALECEKLGVEAIRTLPRKLIIRGIIANLTAKAAAQLKHADIMNECYEAAFFSKSTLEHYLRLFELPDYQSVVKRGAQYIKSLPERSAWEEYHDNRQLKVNELSKSHKKVILFFSGDFDNIYEECIKDEAVLGWSTQFKGVAVPLFILLLNQDKRITKAKQELIDGIRQRIGLAEDDNKSFVDLFLIWKEKTALSKEQYEKYIAWLKKEVGERTEAIVGEGHRKSYYKAALLVTALGETLESNGQLCGRRDMIEHYKKKYPRKRAFKGEFERLK